MKTPFLTIIATKEDRLPRRDRRPKDHPQSDPAVFKAFFLYLIRAMQSKAQFKIQTALQEFIMFKLTDRGVHLNSPSFASWAMPGFHAYHITGSHNRK